jgi:hypothetical protein
LAFTRKRSALCEVTYTSLLADIKLVSIWYLWHVYLPATSLRQLASRKGKAKFQHYATMAYVMLYWKLRQYSVWLRAGRPGDRGSIPGRGKGFLL